MHYSWYLDLHAIHKYNLHNTTDWTFFTMTFIAGIICEKKQKTTENKSTNYTDLVLPYLKTGYILNAVLELVVMIAEVYIPLFRSLVYQY